MSEKVKLLSHGLIGWVNKKYRYSLYSAVANAFENCFNSKIVYAAN